MKVKILNIDYDLKFEPRLINSDSRAMDGEIRYNGSTIKIDQNVTIDRQKMAFLHEIVHGFNEQLYLISDEEIEKFCDIIANLAYRFIKDNPDIIKWIMEEE